MYGALTVESARAFIASLTLRQDDAKATQIIGGYGPQYAVFRVRTVNYSLTAS